MVLKGFFTNINMKPKIKVNGSQGVVEFFTERDTNKVELSEVDLSVVCLGLTAVAV